MFGNKSIMRTTVFALAAAVSLAATGCGGKAVNYNVDDSAGDSDKVSAAEGNLAETLGVPESCDESFDVGESGLSEITCKVDDIEIPDVAGASRVYYDTCTFDSDTIQNIVESILDKEQGIYVREDGAMTKDEVQFEIDFYQEYLDSATESGNEDEIEYYTGLLDESKEKMKSAVDEFPAATEYSMGNTYYGTHEDREYGLSFSNTYSTDKGGVSFSLQLADSELLKIAAEEDGASDVYCSAASDDGSYDVESMANECKKSEESAVGDAMNFLSSIGVTGVVCTESSPLIWTYYSEDESSYTYKMNGYSFTFVRQINGIDVSVTSPTQADNLCTAEDDEVLPDAAADKMTIYVDDTGVVDATGTIYTDGSSLTDGDSVELLSWDEMISAANESLAEYYTDEPTQEAKVEYDKVSFVYLAYADDDGRRCYIPVWEFTQKNTSYDGIKQLAYINAADGSYIDIRKNSEKLGSYFTW